MTLLRPLQIRRFRRLAAGKLLSHLGDWLLVAALIGWTYSATQSTAAVAALMLLRLLPPILGGGVAAVAVDRLPRDRLLGWIEIARVGAACLAFAGITFGPRALVFAAVAAGGLLAPVASVTAGALVPTVVPREQLPAANAALGIAHELAMAAGALAAPERWPASVRSAHWRWFPPPRSWLRSSTEAFEAPRRSRVHRAPHRACARGFDICAGGRWSSS